MSYRAQQSTMPAGGNIAPGTGLAFLDFPRCEDLLFLDDYGAGTVSTVAALPDPGRNVIDRIYKVLGSVIADLAMRPLGGIAADWQCSIEN